jgi:hypothetical protein
MSEAFPQTAGTPLFLEDRTPRRDAFRREYSTVNFNTEPSAACRLPASVRRLFLILFRLDFRFNK